MSEFEDRLLENKINLKGLELMNCDNRETRIKLHEELAELIMQRSPEQVERMERKKGLR